MNKLTKIKQKQIAKTLSDNQKILILISTLLLIISNSSSAFAKKRQGRLPTPNITGIDQNPSTAAAEINISGNGFINNFNKVHKVYLEEDLDFSNNESSDELTKSGSSQQKKQKRKKKKYQLKITESKADQLKTQLPSDLSFGDYIMQIKLKSRFLKSAKSRYSESIKIRPVAPELKSIEFQALANPRDLSLLASKGTQGLFYQIDPNDTNRVLLSENNAFILEEDFRGSLAIGKNDLRAFYLQSGFESLLSDPKSFYFLPSELLENQLEIESEDPLVSFVKLRANLDDLGEIDSIDRIDLSEITQVLERDLQKDFFIRIPGNPRYLLNSKVLQAVFIEQVHAQGDEFVVLRNRSREEFSLVNCHLNDSLKERFNFEAEGVIPGKSSIKITANLGLNDASPDSVSLICPEQGLIDQFNYSKLDEDGFAIKD